MKFKALGTLPGTPLIYRVIFDYFQTRSLVREIMRPHPPARAAQPNQVGLWSLRR